MFLSPNVTAFRYPLSSSIALCTTYDALHKSRGETIKVAFSPRCFYPLTSLRSIIPCLLKLHHALRAMLFRKAGEKQMRLHFLPGVFEDDVTPVTKIEKRQGEYIARSELCVGVEKPSR